MSQPTDPLPDGATQFMIETRSLAAGTGAPAIKNTLVATQAGNRFGSPGWIFRAFLQDSQIALVSEDPVPAAARSFANDAECLEQPKHGGFYPMGIVIPAKIENARFFVSSNSKTDTSPRL